MSRCYGMTLTVRGHNAAKREEIIEAANQEWGFDDEFIEAEDTSNETVNLGEGVENLCGGETEDEFADRVAKAVMQANGGPCCVEVTATCYENIPCEIHTRDKEFWQQFQKDLQEEQRRDEKHGLYPQHEDIAN